MSKSDENPNGSIYLMDDKDTIMRKCKRAVTDSEGVILYRDEQPGIKNLIDIYSACTGKTPDEVVAEFDGKGYGDFKMAVERLWQLSWCRFRKSRPDWLRIKLIWTALSKKTRKRQDITPTRH